ncbi:Proteasome subunit alpha type-5 [Conglomerata obtusa]
MTSKKDVNAYSPEGRIYQIEYAMQASTHGTTVLAFKTPSSTILLSEKKQLSPLHIVLPKHHLVYDHILFSFSGIASDAREITRIAREYCLNHTRIYNEKVPVESLMRYLCQLALKFSEEDSSKKIFGRPFGVSIVCAGYDKKARLFVLDPSGSYNEHIKVSVGGGSEAVDEELKDVGEVLSVEDGIRKGLVVLKKVMKDVINKSNVEVAVVNEEGVCIKTEDEIEKFL